MNLDTFNPKSQQHLRQHIVQSFDLQITEFDKAKFVLLINRLFDGLAIPIFGIGFSPPVFDVDAFAAREVEVAVAVFLDGSRRS